MNKQNIQRLIKTRKNCIANVEMLLWVGDEVFPSFESIKKADILLEMAIKINKIIEAEEKS